MFRRLITLCLALWLATGGSLPSVEPMAALAEETSVEHSDGQVPHSKSPLAASAQKHLTAALCSRKTLIGKRAERVWLRDNLPLSVNTPSVWHSAYQIASELVLLQDLVKRHVRLQI